MDKSEWINKAKEQIKKNGMFQKDDGLMPDSMAVDLATNSISEFPDLINKDPEEYFKTEDIMNIFNIDDDKGDK